MQITWVISWCGWCGWAWLRVLSAKRCARRVLTEKERFSLSRCGKLSRCIFTFFCSARNTNTKHQGYSVMWLNDSGFYDLCHLVSFLFYRNRRTDIQRRRTFDVDARVSLELKTPFWWASLMWRLQLFKKKQLNGIYFDYLYFTVTAGSQRWS